MSFQYLCDLHLCHANKVHEGKAAIGSLPSLADPMTGLPLYHPDCLMCADSAKLEKEDSNTTNSWLHTRRKLDSPDSDLTLENATPNSPVPMLAAPTFGKKTPEFPARNSSLVHSRSAAMLQLTGMPSERLLSPGIWHRFHPTYLFVVIINSEELAKTIYDQLQWSVPVTCFGVQLELASRVVPGKKPLWMLILKTPTPSFGMATKVKTLLWSMNLGVQSVSPIYSAGWIGIRSLWKLKDRAFAFEPVASGSPPI